MLRRVLIVTSWGVACGMLNPNIATAQDSVAETFLYVVDFERKTTTCLSEARLPNYKWNGSPEWSNDGTRIAFDATPVQGQWLSSHIALYHVLGEKKGTIEDLGLGNAPTWSPDDSQIAFFVNPGVLPEGKPGTWVMDADGGGREWLGAGWFPNWSPAGQFLLLNHQFGDTHALLLHDTVTGTSRMLGRNNLQVSWQPTWFPLGDRFAVIRVGNLGEQAIEIYNRSGKWESRQVVWPRKEVDHGLPANTMPSQVACSPKGDALLIRFDIPGETQCRLCLMPTDGSKAPEMIDMKPIPNNPLDIDWAPDGKRIVFVAIPQRSETAP